MKKELINQLKGQGYVFLNIHKSDDLIKNLRLQIEILNNYKFSDNEWHQFLSKYIDNPNEGIIEKTRKIQEGLYL